MAAPADRVQPVHTVDFSAARLQMLDGELKAAKERMLELGRLEKYEEARHHLRAPRLAARAALTRASRRGGRLWRSRSERSRLAALDKMRAAGGRLGAEEQSVACSTPRTRRTQRMRCIEQR
jgi:hypothetical protein